MIRASRAAYLVCGVLTALALAGWGVRAAGTPHNQTANNAASNQTVPLAAPNNNQANNNAAGNNQAAAGTAGGDQAAAQNGDAANNNAAANNAPAAAPPVAAVGDKSATLSAKTLPRMGQVVVDDQGFVLYRFDKDTANPPASNCKDKCAQVWPPIISPDGNVPQLNGIDQNLVGLIDRGDGSKQVTIGGWPVYRYIGDKSPGKWTGQRVGNTWFVISPNGKKNLTCVPSVAPTAVAPPASSDSGSSSSSGSSGSGSGGY